MLKGWVIMAHPTYIHSINLRRVTKLELTGHHSCTAVNVMRQKSMVVSPAGLGANNDCASEGQQQFTWLSDRNSSVKDENVGDLFADSHNISNRCKNHFFSAVECTYDSDVRQMEMHTAEPL
jgi:hypothetical protein